MQFFSNTENIPEVNPSTPAATLFIINVNEQKTDNPIKNPQSA
jgi:hypothetical protein